MTALTPLDELWLTEAVRLREEHAGVLDDEEANRRARASGGDLQTRIKHRARGLPNVTVCARHCITGNKARAWR